MTAEWPEISISQPRIRPSRRVRLLHEREGIGVVGHREGAGESAECVRAGRGLGADSPVRLEGQARAPLQGQGLPPGGMTMGGWMGVTTI